MDSYQISRIPGDGELSDAYSVRRAVFIDEQDVSEAEEIDGKDDEAIHFVAYDSETGDAVGTARLRIPEADIAKPERVAIRQEYRNEGIGELLMERIESEARSEGCSRAVLHAQTRVIPFYEQLGYEITSEEFEEAGIPHVEMEKSL